MTETLSTEALSIEPDGNDHIDEAIQLIDRGLGQFSERNLVSAAEVADLLLDVRTALTKREIVSIN